MNICFLGPTLLQNEAEKICDALYLPPARQGDLLACALHYKPKTIILIDGNFHSCLSVWHKEILYALHLGIHVIGASSMGALRAAETSEFGMIGIGKIFELYKSGAVQDDDEVALVHGPQEQGYLPLSIPLINLRFTFGKLKSEKKLPPDLCDAYFAHFQHLFYPDRTYEQILAKNLPEAQRVISALQNHYVDQKKEDAVEALKFAASIKKRAPRKEFPNSSLFEIMYHYERRVKNNLSARQIASFVSLHHPNIAEIQFNAMNQKLVSLLARILKIEPTKEEVEEEKERLFFRLKIKEQQTWLKDNHLTEEDLDLIALEKAKARRLHIATSFGQIPWRQVKSLLEELKWRGEYSTWAEKAAAQEDFVQEKTPVFDQSCHSEIYSQDLLETHMRESLWAPDTPCEKWAEEVGFQSLLELKYDILRAKIARDYLRDFMSSL